MLLKRQVRAGILLYALFMLAVFALLLQFYLNGQKGEGQLYRASKQEQTAYLMAILTNDSIEKNENTTTGEIAFIQGKARYSHYNQQIKIQVTTNDTKEYTYYFPLSTSEIP